MKTPRQKPCMSVAELRRRMTANRVLGAAALAGITGYNVSTTYRWLTRELGITRGAAALLRQKLPILEGKK